VIDCLTDSYAGDICSILATQPLSTNDSKRRRRFSPAARRHAGHTDIVVLNVKC